MPSDPTPNQPQPRGKPRRRPAPAWGGTGSGVIMLCVVAVALVRRTMTSPASLDWGDFIALVNHKRRRQVHVKKVTFVGTAHVNGEVDDRQAAGRPAIPAADKLKTGHFTVQRLQVNQDQELQDDSTKPAQRRTSQPRPPNGQPAFNWDQQDEPFAGMLGTVVLFAAAAAADRRPVLLPAAALPRPAGRRLPQQLHQEPGQALRAQQARASPSTTWPTCRTPRANCRRSSSSCADPEKFQRLGAVVPKGVLLVGPPGTGKTLLARAVAGEAGVPFFSISGSEFIQMFVGVGASRVRDMFKTAKENAPCLLFIDEIDAVGRMRGAGVGGGSDEREQTLNQILSEMDGFQPTETVIVMAATNRPDVLDSALLRPGRFDRHVTIDRPTWQGRLAILKVHTRNKPLADDVNLEEIARKMIGMTGADLRNLANEAALLATREGKSKIDRSDFERAADRVLMGAKREEVLTAEEKRRTAYHEAGHALVSWLMPEADPPHKVTIVPRGRALRRDLHRARRGPPSTTAWTTGRPSWR